MKNQKRVFILCIILTLIVGSHFAVLGLNPAQSKEQINDLISKVKDFINQPNVSTYKQNKAKGIQNELDALKVRAGKLNDEDSTEADKIEIKNIDSKLLDLKNRFNDINDIPSPNKSGGANTSTSTSNSAETTKNSDSPKGKIDETNSDPKFTSAKPFSLIYWILIGISTSLIISGIAASVYFLNRRKNRQFDDISANFTQLRKQQRTFGEEISQLTEVSKNLSQQMTQQKAEINALRQSSKNAAAAATAPPPPLNFSQPAKEEPAFPIAVDDYLIKSKAAATPVKYDYKERMLVQDEAREGGLLVVRDPSGALYLVPSFGFFQTKSDYTNYFERYFACARPAGGNVWLRQPATVNSVSGGWQLAGMGELEIR